MAPKAPPPVKELFSDLQVGLDLLKIITDIKKPIQINFKDPDSSYVVDIENKKVSEGTAKKTEINLTFTESDFQDLITGKLNPVQAFMQGKIKFKGNMNLLMKFQGLQPKLEGLRSKY
uniref:SCP2 domain-containing protein n=1 Tax=Aplanochytrium stocchinoi TaxID=215587 RepID=A0A7S3PLD5_9STRA|mmetsp:Transcript_8887/g.11183  ORF Transcript_8887/g.11183 Transcript_8887/m.11183 type:complete len:118 (+) Transcript_8887:113-466(+)|eukprot:CAMPEP_0204828624 /NCGR_PEP_ID=MMETSP1346-20131115/6494_1 /ASSEMBLY_ACC=CAM_ASM_000771 /TAXON_ID=215587 /ORGANISM="Aplanochytrium stocchinoi, Strain GSBS06" /LENGTH=117 /DNA_ID=CAMNT_0051957849 /DNA_START=156 /DNA_END=509 /DNA_ORIENTATION=-